jgi:hypothetical protein
MKKDDEKRERPTPKRAYTPPKVERRHSLDRAILFSGSAMAGAASSGGTGMSAASSG